MSGKNGTDTHVRLFFKHARRSGLWDDNVRTVGREAVSKARKKLPWTVFAILLNDAVYLAMDIWPNSDDYTYKGLSVYAIDGSKYTLPASDELREEFDPDSGLENPGKGHYPQCLVSTAYDVFRRIPVARTVMPLNASEREEAKKLVRNIPKGLLVFDRGYPSYEFLVFLEKEYPGFYLFRAPMSNTFLNVQRFISSKRIDQLIWITPSKRYREKVSSNERKKLRPIRIRALKVKNDAGETVLLLTNLLDKKIYPRDEIAELYRARWGVESYYRDEKVTCELDKFRSRNSNGIMQELLAATVMSVIARTLMVLSGDMQPYKYPIKDSSSQLIDCGTQVKKRIKEPQFAHAIKTLCDDAAVLASDNPDKAFEALQELIEDIKAVSHYRPQQRRQSQPRFTKGASNKWIENRWKEKKKIKTKLDKNSSEKKQKT